MSVQNPFFSSDSYYFALASAAVDKQKSLRELLQILEKFFVISHCYQMNTRESFVIFDILMNCIDDTKKPNIKNQIAQESFTDLKSIKPELRKILTRDERIEANGDPFLAIYTFILENAYKQTRPQIRVESRTPDGAPQLSDKETLVGYYLEKIFTSFSGKKLEESVTQKIAFLAAFHFGDPQNAQALQDKASE